LQGKEEKKLGGGKNPPIFREEKMIRWNARCTRRETNYLRGKRKRIRRFGPYGKTAFKEGDVTVGNVLGSGG